MRWKPCLVYDSAQRMNSVSLSLGKTSRVGDLKAAQNSCLIRGKTP